MEKSLCPYFLLNQCRYGDYCFNSHDIPPQLPLKSIRTILSNHPIQSNTKQSKPIKLKQSVPISTNDDLSDSLGLDSSSSISNSRTKNLCQLFIHKTCNNQLCPSYHGYSEHLLNVSTLPCQDHPILDLCLINKAQFCSCDHTTVKVWRIEDKLKCIAQTTIEKGKIRKLFSYGKHIIFFAYYEELLSEMTLIYFFNDNKVTYYTSKIRQVNECIVLEGILMCFGSNAIEVYSLNPSFSEQLKLIKRLEITNEITAVGNVGNSIFCGHINGLLTRLQYDPSNPNMFKEISSTQIHSSKINRLLIKSVNEYSNYLVSVSNDKTIKVFNIEKGMISVFMRMYGNSIENIFTSLDYENREVFCICFSNGGISVLTAEFDNLFEITAHGNKKRFGITVLNPEKNDANGNFLILNNATNLECNMWINPDAYSITSNASSLSNRKMSEQITMPKMDDYF